MIDAHQHFWRLDRGDYFWIDDSVAKIRRDFLPENLSGEMREAGVSHTILVQATETVAETEFMLSLAADHPTIAGVVAIEGVVRWSLRPRPSAAPSRRSSAGSIAPPRTPGTG